VNWSVGAAILLLIRSDTSQYLTLHSEIFENKVLG